MVIKVADGVQHTREDIDGPQTQNMSQLRHNTHASIFVTVNTTSDKKREGY